MTTLALIWAQAREGVIGADGGMPWHVPEDLGHFRAATGSDDVVMGRRTWESLPARFRPLPGRRNIVVTRSDEWADEGAERASSLGDALEKARTETVWVIGGGQLYREAIERADLVEVTRLDLDVAGDTHAPDLTGWQRTAVEPGEGWLLSRGGIPYRFETYRRVPGP